MQTNPSLRKTTKIPREDPTERQKERKWGGEGTKNAKFWAPHPALTPSGPPYSGPHFFWFGHHLSGFAKIGLARNVSAEMFRQCCDCDLGFQETDIDGDVKVLMIVVFVVMMLLRFRVHVLTDRTQCERDDMSQRKVKFIQPQMCESNPFGGDHDFRTSTSIRQRPIQGESHFDFLG